MEKATQTRSKKNVLRNIFSIIGITLLGLLFIYSFFGVIDRATNYNFPFFGLRNSVVLTESMSVDNSGTASNYPIKQLQVNDLIITYSPSYDDINIGDVVTFRSKSGIICHRVVEKYQSNDYLYLVTKGDANTGSDSPIQYQQVTGKVFGVIPKVGSVVRFIQSPYMLIAVGFSGFIIFGAMFVYHYTETKKKNKNNKQT